MTMRLAFSIMVASVPDVLFIDEVLAVGDFRFRQKCLAKIREIRERTSFVMVSHSMADIRAFCDQVIVLNKGREVFCGAPDEAVEVYENLQFEGDNPREEKQKAVLAPQFENREILTDVEHYWCDEEGRQVETVRTGDPLWFHLSFVASHVPRKLTIGIPVWTDEGVNTTGFSSAIQEDHFVAGEGERVVFRLHIPQFVLNPGIYISNISVVAGSENIYRNANPKLEVTARHHTSWGIVGMPYQWRQLP